MDREYAQHNTDFPYFSYRLTIDNPQKGTEMKKTVLALTLVALAAMGANAWAEEIEVGVAWFAKSGMSNRVVSGMEARLAEIAPQIKLEYRKALPDADALSATMAEFQQTKAGMVIMRSSGTKTAGKFGPSIPTFVGASNHPGHLGVIGNLEHPEGNITGVSYALSAESQFSTFTAVVPGMTSVYLLLEKGHPSSAINDADTKAVCAKLGLDYQAKYLTSVEELEATVAAEAGKHSIFLIGSQSLVMDNTAKIVALAGKTPVLAYAQKPVKDGALCGLAADDLKLGAYLADSLVDVLVDGKNVSDVPVKFDTKPKLYINAAAAERLGLDISYDILSLAEIVE